MYPGRHRVVPPTPHRWSQPLQILKWNTAGGSHVAISFAGVQTRTQSHRCQRKHTSSLSGICPCALAIPSTEMTQREQGGHHHAHDTLDSRGNSEVLVPFKGPPEGPLQAATCTPCVAQVPGALPLITCPTLKETDKNQKSVLSQGKRSATWRQDTLFDFK